MEDPKGLPTQPYIDFVQTKYTLKAFTKQFHIDRPTNQPPIICLAHTRTTLDDLPYTVSVSIQCQSHILYSHISRKSVHSVSVWNMLSVFFFFLAHFPSAFYCKIIIIHGYRLPGLSPCDMPSLAGSHVISSPTTNSIWVIMHIPIQWVLPSPMWGVLYGYISFSNGNTWCSFYVSKPYKDRINLYLRQKQKQAKESVCVCERERGRES